MQSIAFEPNSTQSYVFVADSRLVRLEHETNQWFYYLKDHLGSSDFIMSSSGLPVEQMLYHAYGSEEQIETETTDDHPFYTIDAGWKRTLELNAGDQIETDGNGAVIVESIIDLNTIAPTYNFTIADFNTYYVTQKNVLVHNENCKENTTRKDKLSSPNPVRESIREACEDIKLGKGTPNVHAKGPNTGKQKIYEGRTKGTE